jgi:hypothetical protein
VNETGRLIERVGERAPFPDDAFERMLGRRDRKQRNKRLVAAGVGIAVFVAVMALALGSFLRSAPVPIAPPTVDPGAVTFWGTTENPISVNGVPVDGQMANTPEEVYLYRFSPTVGVPAGAQIVMGDGRDTSEFRGWIDAWWDGPTPGERLYELDLGDTATMPTEPGVYTVEFTLPDPDDVYATFTLLFPIRVVAPEEMGLAFSFDPYGADQLLTLNGVQVPGSVTARDPSSGANYEFVPDRPIEVPTGASIHVEDEATEVSGYVAACCDGARADPLEHLYELELPDGASMPTEPGTYYVQLTVIGTFVTGEPDGFLFPVRVVAADG